MRVLAEKPTLPPSLALDYKPYITGAADLAWYDEKITLYPQAGQEVTVLVLVMDGIINRLRETAYPVAHLKFFIQDANTSVKLSYTSFDKARITEHIPKPDVRSRNPYDQCAGSDER